MPERSSRSVQETRAREAWLDPFLEGEPAGKEELEPLMRAAILVRGALEQIEVPEGAEERSCERVMAALQSQRRTATIRSHGQLVHRPVCRRLFERRSYRAATGRTASGSFAHAYLDRSHVQRLRAAIEPVAATRPLSWRC